MPVKLSLNENSVIALISGEIDHHSARNMREEIDEFVVANNPQSLVLDFKDVSFMDSSGIGLVMGRYKLVSERNGELFVVNTSAHIRKVMKLAGLDKLAKL